MSQTVDVSTLEQCIAMETEELKLRCFEAIIAGSTAGEDEKSDPQESPADQTVPALEIPVAAATVGDASDNEAAIVPATSAAAAPISEVAIADAESEIPSATVASLPGEEAFGQEHLLRLGKDQEKDDALLRVTVVEVSKGRHDHLYFELDNGQVWRQNEARHFPYPKDVEFDVNITRGMMGDYRMRIGDNGRMVRIRRVK
ncbi:MAG: hypothetical protein P8M18_08750 [Woeseiaceae bacterium]|nr:hypothetical protein [Woeseiaceae bacterium]